MRSTKDIPYVDLKEFNDKYSGKIVPGLSFRATVNDWIARFWTVPFAGFIIALFAVTFPEFVQKVGFVLTMILYGIIVILLILIGLWLRYIFKNQ